MLVVFVTFSKRKFILPASLRQPDVNDNRIPDVERPARPTVSEVDIVRNSNEIPLVRSEDERLSNVLMSHASDDSVFSKTEVFAGRCTNSLGDPAGGSQPRPLLGLTPPSRSVSCSSDRGRRRRPDVRRPPGPPPHLSHEEEGRGQLRPGEEAHLQEGPNHGDLRVDSSPSPQPQTHTSPLPPAVPRHPAPPRVSPAD